MTRRRMFFLPAAAGVAAVLRGATAINRSPDIFDAAANGDSVRIRQILAQAPGAANLSTADGLTPLWFACSNGHVTAASDLVTAGAAVNGEAESPLIAACELQDSLVVYQLLAIVAGNGADPNAKRRMDGKSALALALDHGHVEAAKMLRRRGATPRVSGEELTYSEKRFHFYGKNIERPDTAGLPMHFVNEFVTAAHRDLEQVKRMHAAIPALAGARASFDEMPVEGAAHLGRLDIVNYFLDAGTSPLSTCTATVLGETATVMAMLSDDPSRVRERGPHDQTVLQYTAFAEQRVDIAERLLKAGADPNARGLGQTALHIAARRGHRELAVLLLEKGADPNAASFSPVFPGTPLELARKNNHTAVAEVLQARGARVL
jgi:ankyrin repeat protein